MPELKNYKEGEEVEVTTPLGWSRNSFLVEFSAEDSKQLFLMARAAGYESGIIAYIKEAALYPATVSSKIKNARLDPQHPTRAAGCSNP